MDAFFLFYVEKSHDYAASFLLCIKKPRCRNLQTFRNGHNFIISNKSCPDFNTANTVSFNNYPIHL